jgi:hypothetical protein
VGHRQVVAGARGSAGGPEVRGEGAAEGDRRRQGEPPPHPAAALKDPFYPFPRTRPSTDGCSVPDLGTGKIRHPKKNSFSNLAICFGLRLAQFLDLDSASARDGIGRSSALSMLIPVM